MDTNEFPDEGITFIEQKLKDLVTSIFGSEK